MSGRPSKHILETYEQKLAWFKLHHYAGARDLTAYGWYEQILFRKDLLHLGQYRKFKSDTLVELQPHEEALSDVFRMLQNNPLVDIRRFEREHPDWFCYYHYLFVQKHMSKDRGLAVNFATVSDSYLMEKKYANPWRVEEARSFFDSLGDGRDYMARGESYSEYLKDIQHRYFSQWEQARGLCEDGSVQSKFQPWMDDPLHVHYNSNDCVFVMVDTSAPDSVLEEQFKSLVKSVRGDSATVRAPKFFPSDWADAGLLPYMDLKIWTQLNDEPEIPDYIVRDTILPPHRRTDHTIREVTKPAYAALTDAKAGHYLILQMRAMAEEVYKDQP